MAPFKMPPVKLEAASVTLQNSLGRNLLFHCGFKSQIPPPKVNANTASSFGFYR